MQDEVNEKVVSLCIRGGKISAQILKSALLKTFTKLEQKLGACAAGFLGKQME